MTRFGTMILILCTFLSAMEASALLTTYASRAEWETSVGAFQTEDFETTPTFSTSCPEYTDETACPYSITIDAPLLDIVLPVGSHASGYDGIFDNGAVNGSREFRADLHAGILVAGTHFNTIVFPNPILAFAVDLANVRDDESNCYIVCGPFPLTVSIDGEDSALATETQFFGAVSDTPFTEVIIRSTTRFEGYVIAPSLDNISFVVVPEPNSAIALGIGLLILSRRRNDF